MINEHKGVHKSYGIHWDDALDIQDGGYTISRNSFIAVLILTFSFMGACSLVIWDIIPPVFN